MTWEGREVTLKILLDVLNVYPDLRIWQLLMNATHSDELYYISNKKLRERLQQYAEQFWSQPE